MPLTGPDPDLSVLGGGGNQARGQEGTLLVQGKAGDSGGEALVGNDFQYFRIVWKAQCLRPFISGKKLWHIL